ncbi:MAG: class I adenylate-forming enzyme family protein, partial [Dehalococcoidia bacterium]
QRVRFADLRMVFSAGEPSSAQFVEEMRGAFPRAELRTAYLTSEGGGAAACASGGADLLENPGSAGKPISTAAVRVIDESREDLVDREKGFVGEIALRAGSMSVGYWGAAALTDARFVGGWWRSGDLGFVDERGMLTIVGRSDNVINSGGLKVHAEEVEAALMRHPQVRLAAVVGTPDETWGQRIEAFVVVDGTTTGDAILDFCRDQGRLAAYKIPKMIHLRDSLPTGATGKVYRRGLVLRGTELGVG